MGFPQVLLQLCCHEHFIVVNEVFSGLLAEQQKMVINQPTPNDLNNIFWTQVTIPLEFYSSCWIFVKVVTLISFSCYMNLSNFRQRFL